MHFAVIWSVPDVRLGIQMIVLEAWKDMRVNVPYVLVSMRLVVLAGADAGTAGEGPHRPRNSPGQAKHGRALTLQQLVQVLKVGYRNDQNMPRIVRRPASSDQRRDHFIPVHDIARHRSDEFVLLSGQHGTEETQVARRGVRNLAHNPLAASSAARINAAALLRVSRSSSCGSESATIPAPA